MRGRSPLSLPEDYELLSVCDTIAQLPGSSEELARKRLDKKLHQIWSSFCAQSGEALSDTPIDDQTINPTQLHSILKHIGFFSSISEDANSEQEQLLTQKVWEGMNTDGSPYISFADFSRVMRLLMSQNSAQPATMQPIEGEPSELSPCYQHQTQQYTNQTQCVQLGEWMATTISAEGDSGTPAATGGLQQPMMMMDMYDARHTTQLYNDHSHSHHHSHHQPVDASTLTPSRQRSRSVNSTGPSNTANRASQRAARQRSQSLPRQNNSHCKTNNAEGCLSPTPKEKTSIHHACAKSFDKLYSTPIHNSRRRGPLKDKNTQECTFTPAIDKNSKRMEEEHGGYCGSKQPRYLSLMEKDRQKKERIRQEEKVKEAREIAQCTFKPKVNKNYNMMGFATGLNAPQETTNKQVHEQQQQKFQELFLNRGDKATNELTTEDKEIEEFCTFKPVLPKQTLYENNRKRQTKPVGNCVAGYSSHIRRQKHAQLEKNEREKKEENMKLGRLPNTDPEKFQARLNKAKPFNFQLDKRSPKLLLFVDVNLGGGKVGRLPIYEHDSPKALAKSFAKQYELGSSLEAKLEALLQQHVDQQE